MSKQTDETLYEQDPDEIEDSLRAARGDFIVDAEKKEDEDDPEEVGETKEEEEDLKEEEEPKEEEEAPKEEEEDPEEEVEDNPKEEQENLVVVELKKQNDWLSKQLQRLIDKEDVKVEETVEEELDPYDFNKAETKFIELVLAGETNTAVQLRAEINNEHSAIFDKQLSTIKEETTTSAATKSQQAVENEKFDTLIEKLESENSYLDSSSKKYNEDAVSTVNALMTGYTSDGLTKSKALAKAVKKISPMFQTEESKKIKETLGNKKKVETKKKAADTIKKQPAKTTSSKATEVNLDTLDVSKLSEKQFDNLSKRDLAQLRGDIV